MFNRKDKNFTYIYICVCACVCVCVCVYMYVIYVFHGSDGKEPDCNVGHTGSVPGLGRSPGERNGYLLQYPHLKNSIDRVAWQSTVHGVIYTLTCM